MIEISNQKEHGDTAIAVKNKLLYVLHRADPATVYRDAEDMYLILAVVDAVYSSTENEFELHDRVVNGYISGLNRA